MSVEFRATLEPQAQTKTLQWLESKYTDIDGVKSVLEDTLREARRDPLVWNRPHVADVFRWAYAAGSCGAEMSSMLQREGVANLLTKAAAALTRASMEADPQLDIDWDALLDACTSALSNSCGDAVRSPCELALNICRMDTDEAVFTTLLGFSDFTVSETGGRLWAGAVNLTLWLREQQCLVDWSSRRSTSTDGPLRVMEIGCGPALVSAALCRAFQSMVSPVAAEVASSIHLAVTDISHAVVEQVYDTIGHRNGCPKSLHNGGAELTWEAHTLDFAHIPKHLQNTIDVVLGSDVVYDYTIATFVAPALIQLLRLGSGTSILCCESHRDGMKEFLPLIHAKYGDYLEVVTVESPIVLNHHRLPTGVNPQCTLMVFRRTLLKYDEESALQTQ